MICPECEGKKEIYSRRLMNRTNGCSYEEGMQTCYTCRGDGEISDEHAERITRGNAMAEDRKARDMSLREEAQRLGIKPSVLNDLERGRIPRE